jgi:DNA-binding CsgD family transcriptional regulator
MFKQGCYVKILDTHGNFRYGFIACTKERGYILVVDLNEEGFSKINWDYEYGLNVGTNGYKDFNQFLTDTEKKIVPLLAEEQTTGEIARRLGVSPGTIRVHIHELKNKLQVDNREQLCAYCQGIVKVLR